MFKYYNLFIYLFCHMMSFFGHHVMKIKFTTTREVVTHGGPP